MDIGAETLKPYLTGKCGKDFVINSELTLVESLFTKEEFRSCLSTCQRIIDVVWENLNTGHWKDVNDSWRNIYYVTSYYKCVSMEKLGMDVRECVKICDMGILMGVKPSEWSYPLTTLASSLGNGGGPATALHVNKCTDTGNEPCTKSRRTGSAEWTESEMPTLDEYPLIQRVDCPSMQSFQRDWLATGAPVILTNCINHWPAVTKWDIAYIREVAGMRTVPVEIGSRYTDHDWSQQLITMSEFIDKYITSPSTRTGSPRGYLAQHQLFDQVPELMSDICVPEYCCLGENPGADPDINAWFGPQGTISPLHQDPKPNFLCQVRGRKYIKLCHPDMTECLYPNEGILSNTSQIDAENLDFNKFPLATTARFTHEVLYPGEILFMPAKHWHYIRSLDLSFSVSFWWS